MLEDIENRLNSRWWFWPPWTVKEDMLILLDYAKSVPTPITDGVDVIKIASLESELEKSKKTISSLTTWIMVTFKLQHLPPIPEVKDLLVGGPIVIQKP